MAPPPDDDGLPPPGGPAPDNHALAEAVRVLGAEMRLFREESRTTAETRETAAAHRFAELGVKVDILNGRVGKVADDHLVLRQDIEKRLPEIDKRSRDAMISHDALEKSTQAQWRSAMEGIDGVKEHLKQQDEASNKRHSELRIAAEERDKKRTHRENMTKILTESGKAVALAAFAAIGTYLAASSAHQETAQRLGVMEKKIDTVASNTGPGSIPSMTNMSIRAPSIAATSTIAAGPMPDPGMSPVAAASPVAPAPAPAPAPPSTGVHAPATAAAPAAAPAAPPR